MASSIINTFSVNLNCVVVVVDLTWSGLLPTLIIITLTHADDYLHFAEMLARSSYNTYLVSSLLLLLLSVVFLSNQWNTIGLLGINKLRGIHSWQETPVADTILLDFLQLLEVGDHMEIYSPSGIFIMYYEAMSLSLIECRYLNYDDRE